MDNPTKDGNSEVLPPPPPVVPPNFVPQKVSIGKRVPMARRGVATRGQSIALMVNHFKVTVSKTDGFFYHYSVSIKYEDGSPVEVKGIGRRILDRVHETYAVELDGKKFAYDGEKSLFTIGPLPQTKLEFTVILDEVKSNRNMGSGSPGADGSPDDKKCLRRQPRSKKYNVAISYAAKIPMQSIANALRGQDSEHFQEAVRVFDIILRQNAAQQGCLLVRQSFFHNDDRNFVDLDGGVFGCRGFHSSFRPTQGGLSLNMDVSITMIVRPGPVIDFLLYNQKVDNPAHIDWVKAKKTLKNLRVKATNSNMEHKISGLSDLRCKEQMFTLKQRSGTNEAQEVEITVYEYFVHNRKIQWKFSGEMPCLNVGKPKRPTYIPIELCNLVPLQRYTKALSNLQRAALVEKSRQKPQERMRALKNALSTSNYAADSLIQSSGVSISTEFTRIQGRVLTPPKLRAGEGFAPRNGRWNFNQKRLVEPVRIERWAVVNFSARCNLSNLCRDLVKANMKGIFMDDPYEMIEERPQSRRSPAPIRVDEMIGMIRSRLPGAPQFLLCVLPEKKNSDLYGLDLTCSFYILHTLFFLFVEGPWKKKNLSDLGVVTQCIAPTRINDQYLTNLLLKINAKLGGLNSLLTMEHAPPVAGPMVSRVPTLIVGMDVSHGSPGRDVPSVAAVVSSRQWPLISKYRASVRSQPPKSEMIDGLFKPVSATEDQGIFRELLQDFYNSSGHRKPDQIIIFRDGVSESQFNQVLNVELEQIIEACKFLDEKWSPKFLLVVAQKNHHTKIFQANSPDNVPPGTVVDNGICHPRSNDFDMCAHAGMIGTTRPTHHHVLYDELGNSPDDFQEYQRSTTAISVDHLDDPSLAAYPYFKNAKCCWLIKDRECILRVRDQGWTEICYAFVTAAAMYADEVLHRRSSSLGSTQEYLDYMHRYRRPWILRHSTGPFDVPDEGFPSTYDAAFGYVMQHRLSPDSIYPWSSIPTFKRVESDVWDGTVIYRQEIDGEHVDRIINLEEKISIKDYFEISMGLVEKQLDKQPLTGRIRMYRSLWFWKSQEIYRGPLHDDEARGDHAIFVVGYDGEGDDAHFICQNSYGLTWGYRGYVKIKRELVNCFYFPIGTCSPEHRRFEGMRLKL